MVTIKSVGWFLVPPMNESLRDCGDFLFM